MKLNYPTKYRNISAGYPNYSSGRYHGGIDFPCPINTTVCAAADGVVVTKKELTTSYGHYLIIKHDNGISTLYAHNSSLLVNVGDNVKRGQKIAYSGSTGNSTGPHLHFEVRKNGVRINPLDYLGKDGPDGSEDSNVDNNTPSSKKITYTKMKGMGKIISDYTDLYWYTDDSNKPKPWGFYGMKGETINFIGLVDKKYYYGWVNGICQSRIKCLVPIKKVDKQKATILKATGTFTIGVDTSNESLTGTEIKAFFTVYGPPWNSMEGENAYAWSGHGTPESDLQKGVYACAAPGLRSGCKHTYKNGICTKCHGIKFGTKVQVKGTNTKYDNRIYIVKDRGGAIKYNNGIYHFDLLVPDRNKQGSTLAKNGKAIVSE